MEKALASRTVFIKAGRAHLCRVAGNTLLSYMAGDAL